MGDFSHEIEAYALQNALEFGTADVARILPKLFQHGLKKEDIKKVMSRIIEIVKAVNLLSEKERATRFEQFRGVVKKREEKAHGLPELPNITKKMVFRLAPFPSGALHLGNAKTYLLNALYAEKYKAKTLLIMDDTIGSEEKQLVPESYRLLEEAFYWLGVAYTEPMIYKSDRLKIYYDYAQKLIEKDKAYVCHCPVESLRKNRIDGIECGCRQFPPKIQKERWKDMFSAPEGDAVLRIKTDMQHPNPAFRDRVLFKISDREHPRVGKKYRVWPSLEMSWAIDDYELGVTHIIRGNDLMIETDMEKFIWDIFGWKHATTIHTGMVRIKGLGAKMSKSKSQKEIKSGELTGWDDPRTWSIQSLMRRGITKDAIREFVKEIGLNKQDITVPIEALYAANRRIIDAASERYYFVKQPKEIVLEGDVPKTVRVPVHPGREDMRNVPASNEVLISESDYIVFKGHEVRLLHLCNTVLGARARINSFENKKIPKIQWVAKPAEAKILMPDGSWVSGVAEEAIKKLKKGAVIQFERVGFVRYDGTRAGVREFWFAHH